LNAQHLLSNNRQNFEFDTIELVKTGPGATSGKTLEEFTHGLVIETIGTVEDDTLFRKCLRQILGCFCFTGSGRSLGCTTKVEFQRTHQCTVTAISKGSNNQTSRIAQVLVTVTILRIDQVDKHLVLGFMVDVVTQLRQPLEVICLVDANRSQVNRHITGVDVNYGQR